jgi:hypothetical protein
LRDSQEKQRQELQQQQAADHERAAKQPSTSANGKALEQQHQAQTQALAQRHTTEQLCKKPSRRGPRGKARRRHTPRQEPPSIVRRPMHVSTDRAGSESDSSLCAVAHGVQGLECLSLASPHKSSKSRSQGFWMPRGNAFRDECVASRR